MLKKNKRKINNKKEKGFTLVEALIAITILMISVAAPLNLAGKGLVAADIAQRQIVAFYLAQDATETIINIKVGNKLANGDILDGFKIPCISTNGCYVDTIDPLSTGGIGACNAVECTINGKVNITSSGIYRSNNKAPADPFSGFTRYVKITQTNFTGGVDEEAQINTTVWWTAANGTRQTHTLNTNISNW